MNKEDLRSIQTNKGPFEFSFFSNLVIFEKKVINFCVSEHNFTTTNSIFFSIFFNSYFQNRANY